MKKLTLEHLKSSYYLKGWKFIIYKFFLKYVYPSWEEGHKEHERLIKEKHIAYLSDKKIHE
jgi:hypothetical protein